MNSSTKVKFSVLAIICIILFCFAISPVTLQNDTYYTIKIGEHILQNGLTPVDAFTWHENIPYTYPHWAYDVMIYLIYDVGGHTGIYISTILFACVVGIILYLSHIKLNKNYLISFIITLFTMYLLRDYIAARAQLVTFIMFVLAIFCIEMFLAKRKKIYGLWLILISIIIANIHVAVWPFFFILFMPYIAEYILCVFVDFDLPNRLIIFFKKRKLKTLKKKDNNQELIAKAEEDIEKAKIMFEKHAIKRQYLRENPYKLEMIRNDFAKWLILIIIICGFTGFLTPLGDTPYTYLIKTMQGNTTSNISEHLPLILANAKEMLAIIIIYLAFLIFTEIKISARDLFMLGGLLLLALISRRQVSMFILIGSFILNRTICAFFEKYDSEGPEKMVKKMTTHLGKVLVLSLIIIISLYLYWPKRNDKFVSEDSYPVSATEFILENLDIENIRIYNEYNYGSYLLLNDIKVFIDSRADLYTKEFNKQKDIFTDFINISSINLYFEDKFAEYNFTHAIMYKNAKLNLFLSRDSNYKEIYSDNKFVIYERLNVIQ